MDTMYNILMQLPLFQGIGADRLTEVLDKTKFHFIKYKAGEQIVVKGDDCIYFKFLLTGSIRMETSNKTNKIKITEEMQAPNVITPNHFYGKNTYYPCDIYAESDISIMQVDKPTFIKLLQTEEIFLINLLNIISRRSQKAMETFFSIATGNVSERLAFWILNFTQRKSTKIRIISKQKDLYSFFGVPRSIFISTLDDLKIKGIINYDMKEIEILDRERLRELLNKEYENELVKELEYH